MTFLVFKYHVRAQTTSLSIPLSVVRLSSLFFFSSSMDLAGVGRAKACHIAAIPYPGRGHVNAMMNLCKLLASRKADIFITFVVTEEWLGFIGSEPKPHNVCFATIPNVIPSELDRAKNFDGFLEAVQTLMLPSTEQLLDRLRPTVTTVLADCFLKWAAGMGNRTNIPVALLFPMSAAVFSVLLHFDLLLQNKHFPAKLSERGEEIVDYIPGVSKRRLVDLSTFLTEKKMKRGIIPLECVEASSKSQFLLFTSIYELEPEAFDVIKAKFPFPVYSIGPSIPYLELVEASATNIPDYFVWLDSQPEDSVLYISLGSYLSVSSSQMDEFMAGVRDSGVRFLWVARSDYSRLNKVCGEKGMVVPWCEQLRVLCHSSVGGFWTHCGWNSTIEAVFAGLPMLTFPLFADQIPNSKEIVEDWKVGVRLKKPDADGENLVKREEIAAAVADFMDRDSIEGKEMRRRAKQLQEKCGRALAKGGSSDSNLDAFLKNL